MKILIACHYYSPHLGGIETVVENQAALLAVNNDVTILTSSIGASKKIKNAANNYSIIRIPAINFLENRFGIPFPLFSPSIIWKAFRAVKKADIIHVHDSLYISSIVTVFWAKLLNKPVVLTQHISIVPHPKAIVIMVQKLAYKFTGSYIIKNSQKIFIINTVVKEFLIQLGADENKIVSYKNGIDLSLFKPSTQEQRVSIRRKFNLPERDHLVLFVGRFVPKKGFKKLLQSESTDYTIVFVGGEKPNNLKESKHLIFLGQLSQKEIAEVYRASDIFILPSKGEGFPLSIQEAMASGLPIITTDDKGYEIYNFDRNKLLLIEPTVENIKLNINKLLANPQLQATMSQYSISYAFRYFNWKTSIKAIIDTYQEIMS